MEMTPIWSGCLSAMTAHLGFTVTPAQVLHPWHLVMPDITVQGKTAPLSLFLVQPVLTVRRVPANPLLVLRALIL